jgi:uncharacterized SAM-binding protein YcdF (DUF218 family)
MALAMGKRGLAVLLTAFLSLLLFFLATSGSFLVISDPQPADVMVVLAGETDRRPSRALELFSQKYAPRIILDVPVGEKIYNATTMQLARDYVQQLPEKDSITLCPIAALSTKAETHDVAQCLKQSNVHDVLLVTSDYHSRRALSIFKHELPEYQFSVAGASEPLQFGARWWQHRQWAKLNIGEWIRFVWWEAVDRWI